MTLEEIRRLAADVARRPATATEAECSRALHSLADQLEAAQGREQWAQDRAFMYAKQLEEAKALLIEAYPGEPPTNSWRRRCEKLGAWPGV